MLYTNFAALLRERNWVYGVEVDFTQHQVYSTFLNTALEPGGLLGLAETKKAQKIPPPGMSLVSNFT